MGLVSLLAQVVGICIAIYLMFSKSFSTGFILLAIVGIGHFAASKLANALMLVHQRTLSDEDRRSLELHALSGMQVGETPKAWSHIASACAVLYIAAVTAAAWYLLQK